VIRSILVDKLRLVVMSPWLFFVHVHSMPLVSSMPLVPSFYLNLMA